MTPTMWAQSATPRNMWLQVLQGPKKEDRHLTMRNRSTMTSRPGGCEVTYPPSRITWKSRLRLHGIPWDRMSSFREGFWKHCVNAKSLDFSLPSVKRISKISNSRYRTVVSLFPRSVPGCPSPLVHSITVMTWNCTSRQTVSSSSMAPMLKNSVMITVTCSSPWIKPSMCPWDRFLHLFRILWQSLFLRIN